MDKSACEGRSVPSRRDLLCHACASNIYAMAVLGVLTIPRRHEKELSKHLGASEARYVYEKIYVARGRLLFGFRAGNQSKWAELYRKKHNVLLVHNTDSHIESQQKERKVASCIPSYRETGDTPKSRNRTIGSLDYRKAEFQTLAIIITKFKPYPTTRGRASAHELSPSPTQSGVSIKHCRLKT